jgi:dihydropteroate synthase
MGILNVTPDSFSDGGCYSTVEQAVERALQLEAEGADLLDIGGESTRPGADAVSAEDECTRVLPVIEALANRLSIPISVDTWKSSVADACLAAGAEIINDISGLTFDPALAEVVARHKAGLVVMHTRGTPQQMQQDTAYADLLGEVTTSLLQSAATARSAGVHTNRLSWTPASVLPRI